MVHACGRLAQMFGLPRSTGQIYGLLYLSLQPLSLDDMVELLGICKASASMGTRQLLAWGAIKQVWVPGNRREFFEVVADLGRLVHGVYETLAKPRLVSSKRRLEELGQLLEQDRSQGVVSAEEYALFSERVKGLDQVHRKLHGLVPLVERLI
jgi:DNA-binding transcriptional regulator GbsR (MarR family)